MIGTFWHRSGIIMSAAWKLQLLCPVAFIEGFLNLHGKVSLPVTFRLSLQAIKNQVIAFDRAAIDHSL